MNLSALPVILTPSPVPVTITSRTEPPVIVFSGSATPPRGTIAVIAWRAGTTGLSIAGATTGAVYWQDDSSDVATNPAVCYISSDDTDLSIGWRGNPPVMVAYPFSPGILTPSATRTLPWAPTGVGGGASGTALGASASGIGAGTTTLLAIGGATWTGTLWIASDGSGSDVFIQTAGAGTYPIGVLCQARVITNGQAAHPVVPGVFVQGGSAFSTLEVVASLGANWVAGANGVLL